MVACTRWTASLALCLSTGILGCATAAGPAQNERQNLYSISGRDVNPQSDGFDWIESILEDARYEVRSSRPGVWRLSVDGVLVLLVAEQLRVRILAPIFALNQLDREPAIKQALMVRLLQSNFERSVDARYALFDGIVFATITHPSRSLSKEDLPAFLEQVVNLHKNTFRTGGHAYSSSPPEEGSVEIDPRQDETLMAPGAFERGLIHPEPPSISPPAANRSEQEKVIL